MVTGPGAVSFTLQNQSSLTTKDVDEITRGLRSQLDAAGIRFVAPDQAAASVTITLSENLQNLIWVAEVHQGTNEPAVILLNVPRTNSANTLHEPLPLIIRKDPALVARESNPSMSRPLKDVGAVPSAGLSPEQIALFRFQEGRWKLDQAMPITHARTWPRDLRGHLIPRVDHLFDAYLPGVFCQSSKAAPLSLACRESDDPWPLELIR